MPNGIEMKRHMTTHEEIWQKKKGKTTPDN